ncbi:hypothetical protein [Bowmanella yangjiangensis]|uniref:Uncharacterized protein n=1 Tax=Bowmanella yangjiangensis TaxID=2811230 RepID=A0ABS3CWK0_9ALTE|nr:hypothetical protein [Bowmanella yangjiangensis]MBN7820781.1 hypothetical protein [Bowmanella yangjiangensis]
MRFVENIISIKESAYENKNIPFYYITSYISYSLGVQHAPDTAKTEGGGGNVEHIPVTGSPVPGNSSPIGSLPGAQGGGSNGGYSGSGNGSGTGSIDAQEQCELKALDSKRVCLNTANGIYASSALLCLGFTNPVAIAGCEGASWFAYEDAKSACEQSFAQATAMCD